MDREILFRGKRIDNGEWVEGYFVKAEDVITDTIKTFIIWEGAGYYTHGEFGGHDEVIPEAVGQYTGLKDKNGRKIFEGDVIVQARSGYDKYAPVNFKFKSVVKWGKRSAQFNVENVWTDKQNQYKAGKKQKFSINPNCEVIGNIHDTEETL